MADILVRKRARACITTLLTVTLAVTGARNIADQVNTALPAVRARNRPEGFPDLCAVAGADR